MGGTRAKMAKKRPHMNGCAEPLSAAVTGLQCDARARARQGKCRCLLLPHLGPAAAMARSKSSCRESSGEMGTTGQVAGFSIALLPLYRATAQTGPMEGRASLCARVPAPPEQERLLLTPQARPALAASLPSPDCLPAT